FPSSALPLLLPSFPSRRSSDLSVRFMAPRVSSIVPNPYTTTSRSEEPRCPEARHRMYAQGECADRMRREGTMLEGDGNTRSTERDRKSTRLNSSHVSISYAVFC